MINASWGSAEPSNALWRALEEIDLPVVVSAGNTGRSLEEVPTYPAAWDLDNVISVAAVDHTGALANFSAYSRQRVAVAVPGVRIAGPYPGGRYALSSGTSQAAPLVSGTVALALQPHPELSTTSAPGCPRAPGNSPPASPTCGLAALTTMRWRAWSRSGSPTAWGTGARARIVD